MRLTEPKIKYKPIATEFRHDGFNYKQIAREDDVAIYEQKWTGCSNPSVAHEVVRIRRHDGFEIGGKVIEPAEVYPRSEAWGVDGFTVTDRDVAFARLKRLQKGLEQTPEGPVRSNAILELRVSARERLLARVRERKMRSPGAFGAASIQNELNERPNEKAED